MDQAILDTGNHLNHDQLKEHFGLDTKSVETIAQRILTAFNQATSNDALSAAGQNAYLTAVRALRDVLCPRGWEPVYQNNLELTRNPDTGVALLVSSGNINTGNKNKTPMTKNPKGKGTKSIVSKNLESCSMFPEFEKQNTVEYSTGPYWYFLYCIDNNKREMRVEISLPVEMDYFGSKIDGWKTRLIQPAIDLESSPILPPPEFAGPDDFEIRRKSNDKE